MIFIQQFNQEIKNVWRNFAEYPSTGKLFKTLPIIAYRQPPNITCILIHSKLAIPPQQYKEVPNVMKNDAKYAI